MKKIILLSAIVSTMMMAGGDIAPVEPVIDEPAIIENGTNFYIGMAYGYMNEEYTRTPTQLDPKNFDDSISSFMMLAGYNFNEYIAVEARYWYGQGSDLDVTDSNGAPYTLAGPNTFGIYAKPQYPVTDAFNVYALLGYAYASHNSVKLNDLDGFSWGMGGAYKVMDNVSLFIDYTSIYNDDNSFTDAAGTTITKDYTLDSWNFGIAYTF